MKRFLVRITTLATYAALPLIVRAQGFNLEGVNPIKGANDLDDVVTLVAFRLLGVAIPIASLMYIWAGILYITAGGNYSRLQKAKDIFKWTTVGITIVLIGGGFVDLIQSVLSL